MINYYELLKQYVCTVIFTKKDGSIRKMICTLKEDILPLQTDLEEQISKKTSIRNSSSIAAFDLESKGWRSFLPENVISFEYE